ncbi:MAG: hypothetical protein DHS20C21_05700 [Gemmatimonadota bacterium]|nr:MAG: hypothetical protein DHS20C21_05700 [Gemmatimonadota bacterium]
MGETYTVYTQRRPLRVAFLVEDRAESNDTIDKILSHCRKRWGGRYNPIVLTDGRAIPAERWALLEAVDPDVVWSSVRLDDELVGQIARRLSPLDIHHRDLVDDGDRQSLHLQMGGLSVLPTASAVRTVAPTFDEPCLVLLDVDERNTEPRLRRFIEWNFGGYSPPDHATGLALEGVRTESHRVSDVASVGRLVSDLTSFRSRAYPIQLCSIPSEAVADVEGEGSSHTFELVVGDAPADVAHFWNHPTMAPQWTRAHLRQLWLATDVAEDQGLMGILAPWIQRLADPGGSHQNGIRVVSSSVPLACLRDLVAPLLRASGVSVTVAAIGDLPTIKVRQAPPGPPPRGGMDFHRAAGRSEELMLTEPGPPIVSHGGEHWMADVFVAVPRDRHPTIMGRELWWQAPRVNALASHMFQRPSRVLRTRFPSVLMRHGQPQLSIRLPDEESVLSFLATVPDEGLHAGGGGRGSSSTGRAPYCQAHSSDKGRYLSGLLDVFGGLHPASRTAEERFWRKMFDLLSGRRRESDEETLQRIESRLKKRIGSNPEGFHGSKRGERWLSQQVFKMARELPDRSRDLSFAVFEKHAGRETDAYNANQSPQSRFEFASEELKEAIADLSDRGVLLMGLTARCPGCGYRAWHHIDDAKQELVCLGCKTKFTMPPEPRWYYRLNSLVRAAYADHGLLPVVLVLGQILLEARSSFLFAPCLDLYEKGSGKPVGDLDVAAIVDGQFVIGEVKQSKDLFDEKTFAKMGDIARRLLPDVVLFASMDRDPGEFTKRRVQRLSEELGSLGIEVKWYALHDHKFEPSPFR